MSLLHSFKLTPRTSCSKSNIGFHSDSKLWVSSWTLPSPARSVVLLFLGRFILQLTKVTLVVGSFSPEFGRQQSLQAKKESFFFFFFFSNNVPDNTKVMYHLVFPPLGEGDYKVSPTYFFFSFLLFFSFLFRASSAACGGSRARGQSGTVATSLCQNHSNMGSEPQL